MAYMRNLITEVWYLHSRGKHFSISNVYLDFYLLTLEHVLIHKTKGCDY